MDYFNKVSTKQFSSYYSSTTIDDDYWFRFERIPPITIIKSIEPDESRNHYIWEDGDGGQQVPPLETKPGWPILIYSTVQRAYAWYVKTDLGFSGVLTNGVDTREVSWPSGGGMQQLNIAGNNITLTINRNDGHVSGVKYEKYKYVLDTNDPKSLN